MVQLPCCENVMKLFRKYMLDGVLKVLRSVGVETWKKNERTILSFRSNLSEYSPRPLYNSTKGVLEMIQRLKGDIACMLSSVKAFYMLKSAR